MAKNWKEIIDGCFGIEDGKFARYPLDKERAIELFQECYKNVISLRRVLLNEVENYLKENFNFNSQTIEVQNNMQKHINN